jgi:hypothetical protein
MGRGTVAPNRKLLKSAERVSGRPAKGERYNMILQASSPDEVALVKYSNSMGMELIERDRTFV